MNQSIEPSVSKKVFHLENIEGVLFIYEVVYRDKDSPPTPKAKICNHLLEDSKGMVGNPGNGTTSVSFVTRGMIKDLVALIVIEST